MKKNPIKEVFLLLMLTTLFILILSIVGSAETLEVDDDAVESWYDETHVHTIQEAVDNASVGDSIFVYNGTYVENVSINKQVNVSGESIEGVVVKGQFTVSNTSILERMTISNVTSGGDFPSAIFDTSINSIFTNLKLVNNIYGIFLSEYSYGNIISNNLIGNNDFGIHVNNFGGVTAPTINDITIMDNNIEDNYECGIHIENSNNNTIKHNRILNNVETGIYYLNAEDNLIYDNYFDNENNADGEGTNIWNISLTDNIDGREQNIIGGEWFGGNYWSEYSGLDLFSGPEQNIPGADGIGDTRYEIPAVLIDYRPLTYTNFNLYVDDDADESWYDETHVHSIQEAIDNASAGATIVVHNGTYPSLTFVDKLLRISGESIDEVIVSDTIEVYSNFTIIENMTLDVMNGTGDYDAGIYDSSSNSSFQYLKLMNNTYGIYLSGYLSGTIISDSRIENNNYGIYADGKSFNTFFSNRIINNEIGIYLQYSNLNMVYNNYFDNINNVIIMDEIASINSWNLPSMIPGENIIGGPNIGGNYWNDYFGMDNDADGIGDDSHVVYSDATGTYYDLYPLTNHINHPPILGEPDPADESYSNLLELDWSIPINDDEGGFRWNISCSNGQSNQSAEDENGTKKLHLSDLSYGTTYTVHVTVYDWALWTNQTFTFTTKDKPQEEKKEEPINRPPLARPGGPYTSFPNGQIQFDGSSSSDPDGYITSYTWTFGDGNSAAGETCTHSYSNEGTYTITLTVIDNKGKTGSSTTTAVIVKPNNPPEIQSSIDYDHDKLTVQLSLTVTDADGDDISCTINWDDSTSTSLSLTSGESVTQSHTYSAYGLYSNQITANDGSTDTSKTHTFSLFSEENKEKGSSSGFFGFLSTNSENESFLENQIDGRSLFGNAVDKKYVIPAATAASIILLFLFNFLIEFFSDYSSEHALDFRKDKKDKSKKNKKRSLSSHKYLNKRELLSILVTTLLLSFVLTWTWVSDFSVFIELFLITLFIVSLIFLIRESIRSYLCHKQNIQSEFYVWPLGSVMMIVSTVIGNTFSLAANHHYDENGDIKKCGRVNFTVSLFMYLVVLSAFITNLIYPSIVLQMIVIVSILNLFIDLFPFRPMDGYELRQWNLPVWAVMYVLVFISYVVVYFNLFP